MSGKINFEIFLETFNSSNLSKADLGRMMGLKSNALQGWFDRESVPNSYLYPLADALHVNPRFLLGETEDDTRMQIIPIIGNSTAVAPSMAIVGHEGYENVLERHYFGEGVYAVVADSDSMAGKIDVGSICLCDPKLDISEGNVVHFSYGDQKGIMRYKLSADKRTVVLDPDNKKFDPVFIAWDSEIPLTMVRVFRVEQDI